MSTKTCEYKGLEKAIRDCTLLSIKKEEYWTVDRYSLFSLTAGKFNISDHTLIGGMIGTKAGGVQIFSFGNYGTNDKTITQIVGPGNFGKFDDALQFFGFGNFGSIGGNALQLCGFGNFGKIGGDAYQIIGFGNFGKIGDDADQYIGFGNFGNIDGIATQYFGLGNFGKIGDAIQGIGLGNFGKIEGDALQVFGFGNFGKVKGKATQHIGLGNFGTADEQKSYLSIGNFGEARIQTGGLISISKNPEKQKSLINIAFGNKNTQQYGLINYSGNEGITFGKNKAYKEHIAEETKENLHYKKESNWKFNLYNNA